MIITVYWLAYGKTFEGPVSLLLALSSRHLSLITYMTNDILLPTGNSNSTRSWVKILEYRLKKRVCLGRNARVAKRTSRFAIEAENSQTDTA